ncbi:MAG: hypothetical protein ACOYVF_00295 [Candidatus Zixiibacteriota bacterium]
MTDEKEQELKLHEGSLAFFGAVTASVSHELNNVISIIDQNAGLLGDLLAGVQHGRPLSEEQLKRVADKITMQTGRGVGIIKRLNTFAHSADKPVREFDLNAVIENLTALTERLANLKAVKQEVIYPNRPLIMTGNPFLTQQMVFLIIRELLDQAVKNDVLRIELYYADGRGVIEISLSGKDLQMPGNLAYLEMLSEVLKAGLVCGPEKARNAYEIFLSGAKA